jgi:hypothetical protein
MNPRFSGKGFGKQRLAVAGRSLQDESLRHPHIEFGVFGVVLQHVHALHQFLFDIMVAADIAEPGGRIRNDLEILGFLAAAPFVRSIRFGPTP